MSIVVFKRALAELGKQADDTTQRLQRIENAIKNVKGPMDELRARAEEFGSATADINGVMVEMVSLAQDQWAPALEGVMWDMYEITKTIEEQETVSRDILDRMAKKMDEMIPQYDLWTKHWLALAEQGELTLDELTAMIEEWFASPGIIQLNSMLHGDINGFIQELRRMMKEINAAADEAERAADRAAHATDEVRNTTSGVPSASGAGGGMGSSKGSSSGGSSGGGGMNIGSPIATALVNEIRGRIVR